MNSESRTLIAIKNFKKNNIHFKIVPFDSAPSLPIPIIKDGKQLLSFIYYMGKRTSKEDKIKIYRPNLKITINISNARIVQFQDYSAFDEFPDVAWTAPIGVFPHDAISKLTLKEYKQQKDDLICDYDRYFDLIMKGSEDGVFRKDFSKKFYKLCEPEILPFMEKVGKDFFNWLKND